MWLLQAYRMYLSIIAGGILYFFVKPSILIWCAVTVLFRTVWYLIERQLRNWQENKAFAEHSYPFKQLAGPYGIRLINKAENDMAVRKSLAEVFTPDLKKLRKAVENLELLDTLFKAGMRPDGDDFQLHDLKLKYGKYRLEKEGKNSAHEDT